MNRVSKVMLSVVALVLAATSYSFGQTAPHVCGAEEINNQLIQSNPVYMMGINHFENDVTQRSSIPVQDRTTTLYTLPVVVHIIHNGEAYGVGPNITDEQVYSAITALNNDFRHVAGGNGDGAGPDIGIQFCLASRNPSGQSTNGINRVNGSSVANYSTQGITAAGTIGASESAVKALSTWPRTDYINIWVVSEIENNDGASGTQGYAYFPFNSPLDGIVVMYNAFGTTGNLKSYTNMNRTLTHEMGHVLMLYHTFNETTACGAELDCVTQGDRVCDTPATISNSSCTVRACSNTQQVENYMDYTPQTCQDMFTDGQKLRMRTCVETSRVSLLSSLGCVPVSVYDIGINNIVSPVGTSCSTFYTPQVSLINYGSATLTAATIHYNIDGSGSSTYSWIGSLATGATALVSLPPVNATVGAHTFYAWTTGPNGTADQNSANDQSTSSFTVAQGSTMTLTVVLDYFGHETTWEIQDGTGQVMDNGGPYQDNAQGTSIVESICLPEGCYSLIFHDVYGDGQSFTAGSFTLRDASNAVLVTHSGNWGSTSTSPFCVTAPATGSAPVASFTVADNIMCTNAFASFTSTSSNSPTSYSWTFQGGIPNTSTSANPSGIQFPLAGTYNVTLTATNAYGSNTYVCNNCITTTTGPTIMLAPTPPQCSIGFTGSITATPSGNYPPYTFLWNTGATTAVLANIPGGTYSVTVTNAQGCSTTTSNSLNAPAAISISSTVANVSCNGAANGSIVASATGGVGTKTFSWSNGSTGPSQSGLAPGTYTTTATDTHGCTQTATFTITEPTAIAVTGISTNPTCSYSANGSITVSASGGTGSKTYAWSNGVTSAVNNNLVAGDYSVTVTDANNCHQVQNFTLTAPEPIVISGTVSNPACHGSLGSINVNATGGTGNKTITWSTGATGNSITNLTAGTYTATATDASGCSSVQSFTISVPAELVLTGLAQNPSCFGSTDGIINVSNTGGSGVVSYSWNNGATGATLSDIGVGTYTVTAADANGCSTSQTFTLTQPTELLISVSAVDPICGAPTGSASASATGGSGTYNYYWDGAAGASNLAGIVPGNHDVEVVDAHGCSSLAAFQITASIAMEVQLTATDITCHGQNDGSVSVEVSGGVGNYTYLWSNGATATTLSGLGAGTYSVTVTDGQGCTAIAQIEVVEPQALTVSISNQDVSCFEANNGSVSATTQGGTGTITYLWNNGSTASVQANIAAGTYQLTVHDVNGCSASQVVNVNEPSPINAIAQMTAAETCAGNNGSAEVIVEGGNPDYTYLWSNGNTGAEMTGASAGSYLVTITDANGCSVQTDVDVAYDCVVVVPTTQLISTDCGAQNLNLDYTLTADAVDNATMYQWRFASIAGQLMSVNTTTTPTFQLSSAPQIQDGQTYVVAVKVQVNGSWGVYGDNCLISLLPAVPTTTQLIDIDCGATITSWDHIITATVIPGVVNYEWHFVGTDYDWTTFTNSNSFMITNTMGFVPGETYTVEVRCALGAGLVTDWGGMCPISFDMILGSNEIVLHSGSLLIYPNPSNGQKITLDFSNLPENGNVSNLEIFSTSGSLVETMNLPTSLTPKQEYNFTHPLSAGMYVIHYTMNGKNREEKLIVR